MSLVRAHRAPRAGTLVERGAARLGLAGAVVLLRLPFRWTVRVARVARYFGRGRVEPGRGEELVAAVRYVGRRWPVRIACMETSLGAVLAAAILRRHLTWCLGARFVPPPVEYHAWVEAPGQGPVGEYTAGGRHHHAALSI
ncbi:lasso peptide biosynthesis B2 protein [Streptomyces alkaliphilus]|uniref:lasso peptide biosynthesis B2 protein n=1 Tax=Streptomyces alkaliphilus TaxID=1472722 RepID=UPI00117C3FA6|nr:lasso peptide biosynthesis B2 protein [Streptomyces alkaliphilus]MQS06070.1 lasso peptide biosynthesis B2 protein [Streptomyces alkaliphilus]